MKNFNVASIYLFHTCNYNCSYCTAAQSIDNRLGRFSRAVTEEGMEKIIKFFNERGQWHILYAGGEPTIHPHFIELTKKLSQNHYIRMATNNSMNDEKLQQFVKEIDPMRFDYIQCSLQEKDEEKKRLFKFVERAKILKENGFKVFVTYVAVPTRLELVKKYYELFMENGIPFVIQPFRGKFNGLIYPDAYTCEEREFLDKYMISAMYRSLLETSDRKPFGKDCNAGYKRVYIDGISGKVYKCLLEVTNDLGNIYENNINLSEKPEKCKAKTCTCIFEPHLEIEELLYKDLDKILKCEVHYDKYIFDEYKNKSLEIQQFSDYWKRRQREILQKIFKDASGKVIGIYGSGKHTEKIFEVYKEVFGQVDFQLVFFDSDKTKWNKQYLNSKILDPKSIPSLNLDRIIISSHRFQEEIYKSLKQYEDIGVKIMKIYDKQDTIIFI
ncbi:radical SAM protein [Clostridium sp. P21]|uniref:Radical SAM protein n=1 Tax=Clostridium muellerianum TaxID=2716538 RepID=A0A7Y0HMZ8_9CLOT|nr:radical SAM protein [Clostridium muellerianum]NMM61486.1 radical SAM protein [Clostridium muellerianum]